MVKEKDKKQRAESRGRRAEGREQRVNIFSQLSLI